MPAFVSPSVLSDPLTDLKLPKRGKVRDTYEIDDEHLLIVASDRISIFDFVLGFTVPMKGVVLNAMSIFWLTLLRDHYGIASHLVASGSAIDRYLPLDLHGDADLRSRSMVVTRQKMIDVEFICRAHLTGSGLSAYRQTNRICGHELPPGLADGDRLPWLLDTPTTKAAVGHDEHIDAVGVRQRFPQQTFEMLKIFQIVYQYAYDRGIVLPDTKFEYGDVLADEVLTPDSSRFWLRSDWEKMQQLPLGERRSPIPYDKQLVRNWGKTQGIDQREPSNPEDCKAVAALQPPPQLVAATTQTYRYIFWRLVGQRVEEYLRSRCGVELPRQEPAISVVFGSESDLTPEIRSILGDIQYQCSDLRVHVMSCHRNPDELRRWIEDGCDNADVVVAAGGKALALPGIIKAQADKHLERHLPVIGVGLGERGTKAYQAALLSIEELPNQPVIINELTGEPYMGEQGFRDAIDRVVRGELPPAKPPVHKPVQLNLIASRNGD